MSNQNDKLFCLLQSLKEELTAYKTNNEVIQTLIQEELSDINTALSKWNNGQFGTCEQSGEEIPKDWLDTIPTLKSSDDWYELRNYAKVSIPFN
ncbi:MAG: TraR/DksA family transcriptional regulator [Heyndrickxia sp.]